MNDQKRDPRIVGASGGGYRVLARRYRPSSLTELVGQGPVVRILTNAFQAERLAQAYMLTGVRGVGKTTTARILARAFNHQMAGGPDRPSTTGEFGIHCSAILESRHMDVIEMDAASHTGISDVRELIERASYRPVSARYKVYIVDEVHMLSNQAFNGLLKLLEEPPLHVKFIFATTEIHKVPVTVLSRCQRFDLRRIDEASLIERMRFVLMEEGFESEDEALALIARASEGSMRDALSLLDQAIAQSGRRIEAAHVLEMLGLVDRAGIIDLFSCAIMGDAEGALRLLQDSYRKGAEPVSLLSGLADFVRLVTRVKYVPEAVSDPSLTEVERRESVKFSQKMDVRVLSRAWQMLLKGIDETRNAPWPLAAAEMFLVRMTHLSSLPTPDEAIRMLREGKIAAPVCGDGGSVKTGPALEPMGEPLPRSFDDLVALAERKRDLGMLTSLKRCVRPLRCGEGIVEMVLTEGAPPDFAKKLADRLRDWTAMQWEVKLAEKGGGPTWEERDSSEKLRLQCEVAADEDVAAVLARFPGAEIVEVKNRGNRDSSA